jgi:hypothetical protein
VCTVLLIVCLIVAVLEDTNASVIVMEKGLGNLEELKQKYKVGCLWLRFMHTVSNHLPTSLKL